MKLKEQTLTAADGIDLHVRVAEPERETIATVVIVHGMGEHSGRYGHVLEYLSDHGFRCITYDLRGHGRSGGRRGYLRSYEHFFSDLQRVLEMAGSPRFLYGHSLGGQIVLNFIANRQPNLAGAIVASPWLRLAFRPPGWKILMARLAAFIYPAFTQTAPHSDLNLSRDQAFLRTLSDPHLVHRRVSAIMFRNLLGGAAQAQAAGPAIRIPLLLMHGAADPVTSADASRAFFESVAARDKTLRIYPGMLHEVHNELGRRGVLEEIVSWLSARCGGAVVEAVVPTG